MEVVKYQIIFADNFITDELISSLGIEDTCPLRCDKYHLLHEVWPSSSSFGEMYLASIKVYLVAMLDSRTKDQWDNAYNRALKVLQNNPRKAKKLQDIYNRPSYYSGYYLRSIKGNMRYQGSTPAEINHSSNVAYFGNGNNWTVMKQINEMMKRQQNHEK